MGKIAARKMRSAAYTLDLNEQQVMYYRTHPVEAAKDLLGINLIWLQRIAIRTMWFRRFPLLNMGRGVGKSFIMSVCCLLTAMLYPKTKIGIIAPVFRQANYVFDYIDDMWSSSPYLRRSTLKQASRGTAQSIIKFHNGSYVEALPVGDGTKIRGRRYNHIYIDEYAQMDDMIIKLVIRPMLNVGRGNRENKLIVASTSYYRWNHYWTLYLLYMKNMMQGNADYGIVEFDYEDVLATKNSPYKIDMEILKMQLEDMTIEEFQMENKCLFPADSVGFISSKLLDQCTPKINPIEPEFSRMDDRAIYVLGVDAARQAGGDNFAMTVLKVANGKQDVVGVYTLNGRSFQEMTRLIRETVEAFNIDRIHIGQGGGGLTLKDLLAEPWTNSEGDLMPALLDMDDAEHQERDGAHIVKIINESPRSNNELYFNMKAEMQHARLRFPVDVATTEREEVYLRVAYKEILNLKRELLVLQAEPSGLYHRFTVPSKFKKDRATSLVMAIDAALELTRVHQKKPIMPLAIGQWV